MNEADTGNPNQAGEQVFIKSAEQAEAMMPTIPFLNLFQIWDSWPRPVGTIPCRASLDPIDLKACLPNLIFVERLSDGDFYYRVAGGHIVSSAEFEPTGKRISEFPNFIQTEPIAGALNSVLERSLPRFEILSGVIFDKRWKTYSRLLLPLARDDGTPTYVLGCIVGAESERSYGLAEHME